MRRVLPAVLVALAACSPEVAAVNPYDPSSEVLQPGTVIGTAVLADGAPAPEAEVTLEGPGLAATTGADGTFRFEQVTPSKTGAAYAVTISAQVAGLAYGPARREGIVVPIGGTVDLGAVVLPLATGAVTGTVVAGGQPISGALVSVEGSAVVAVSLGDGRFALTGSPVGRRRVIAAADGFRFGAVEVEIPAQGAASATLEGTPFGASAELVEQEGAAPGFARQRAILVHAEAAEATRARASEDPAFRDAGAGDVALRSLVDPLPVELPEGDDGERTLHVQLADASDQRSSTAAVRVFLDRAPPAAPAGSVARITADPALELPLAVADPSPSSGLGALSVSVDGGAPALVAAGSALELGALPEGLRLLRIAAVDRAGNTGPELSTGTVIDRTAPVLARAAVLEDDLPGTAGDGFVRARDARLRLALDDDGRRALEELGCGEGCSAAFDVEVLRGAASGDRFLLVPDLAGEIRVPLRLDATDGASGEAVVRVADPAGNRLELTVPYTLDATPPRIRALELAAGARYTSEQVVPLVVATDADADGLRHVVLDSGPCLPQDLAALPFQPLAAPAVDLGLVEGPRVVCVQVTDAAGNLSEVAATTVIADRTAPVPLALAALTALVGVELPAATDGLLVEKGQASRAAGVTAEPIAAVWAAATDLSPLELTLVAVDAGAAPSFAGLPAAPLASGVPQRSSLVLPPGDGAKELHARIRDAAGNELFLGAGGALSLTLDRLPPDAPWIQPVSGVIDAPPRAGLPSKADVVLSFTGLDDDEGEILELYAARVAPPGGGPVIDAEFAWTDVQAQLDAACVAGAYRCLHLVVSENRTTRLFLRTRDLAGNLSAESAVEIAEDSTGPGVPVGLSLTAGDERVTARWSPPVAVGAGPASQATEVAGYEVWYGSDSGGIAGPLQLAGAVAAEGPSPLLALSSQLQLTGLQNGGSVAVAVRAFDAYAAAHPDAAGRICPPDREAPVGFDPAAAHCSPFTPVERSWPGQVTPEELAALPVAGGLDAIAVGGGYAWAIGAAAGGGVALHTFDLARPAAPVELGAPVLLAGEPRAFRRHGALACVAHGTGGASVISLANPRAPVVLSTVTTLDDARGCDLSRGRLAVAFRGVDGPARPTYCDPLRRAGVVVYDVSSPAAPAELSRHDNGDHLLLGTPTDVLLLGDELYASMHVLAAAGCPYADGDLLRVHLPTGAIEYGDIGEGGSTTLATTDGMRLAALRGGRIGIYEVGSLPYADPGRVRTLAPLPQILPVEDAVGAVFLGPRLYVANPASLAAPLAPAGSIQVIDPSTAQLVGRIDLPNPRGIAGEGATAVVASASGLHVLRLASPTGLRLSATASDYSNLKQASSGPLAWSARGGTVATFDLTDGLDRHDDYSDPGNPDLLGNHVAAGCASFAIGASRDRLITGCHGGVVQEWERVGRSYTLLGSLVLPGGSDAPHQIVIEGDRVYMSAVGPGGNRLHVLELAAAGLVHRGSVLLPAVPLELTPIAIQGTTVAVGAQSAGLVLIDAANAAAPVILPVASPVPNAGGVAFAGSVLFVSTIDPTTNVVSFDLTNRLAPVLLGSSSPAVDVQHNAVGSLVWSAGMLFATLFYADGALFDATDPAAPLLAGGVVHQLRHYGVDATFGDTFVLLGSTEAFSRLDLE